MKIIHTYFFTSELIISSDIFIYFHDYIITCYFAVVKFYLSLVSKPDTGKMSITYIHTYAHARGGT